MDLLGRAKQLESAIASKVEGTARRMSAPPAVKPPLEVAHAVVEAVANLPSDIVCIQEAWRESDKDLIAAGARGRFPHPRRALHDLNLL